MEHDINIITEILNKCEQGLYQEICYGYAKVHPSTAYNSLIKNYEIKHK